MSRMWTVAHSRYGNWVYLYELDRRARIWATLGSIYCVCHMPGWLWDIPFGRPKRDVEGWLENSLGSALWGIENWFARKISEAEDRCLVRKIPVDTATILALAPDWAFLFGDES